MRRHFVRAVGILGCLLLGFALSPTAHAAFTGRATATGSFATAKLEAPASPQTDVTIRCGLFGVTITVQSYGRVAYANFHEVAIYRGLQTSPVFVGDLDQDQGTYHDLSALSGSWRVEIRGKYRVKDSTNVWSGPPVKRTLTC